MPKVLAIETSTSLLGVAVAEGDKIRYEEVCLRPRAHSAMLLPMCVAALEKSSTRFSELDCIAVSVGPGSFTGLRIGCATAQGLAHAWGLRVAPVSTFDALLEQALPESRQSSDVTFVAIVQGKAKAQTVTALYFAGSEAPLAESIPVGPRSVEEFAAEVAAKSSGRVYVTGDAAVEFRDFHEQNGRKRFPELELSLVSDSARLPKPSTVALVGERMFMQGRSVEPREAVPRYYRKSSAEAVKSAANRGGGEHGGEQRRQRQD